MFRFISALHLKQTHNKGDIMETGIKETQELLKGIELLLIDVKKVAADGKLNLADLPVAKDLVNQLGELTAAIQGVKEVPAEIKNLSAEELQAVGAQVLAMFAAIKAA